MASGPTSARSLSTHATRTPTSSRSGPRLTSFPPSRAAWWACSSGTGRHSRAGSLWVRSLRRRVRSRRRCRTCCARRWRPRPASAPHSERSCVPRRLLSLGRHVDRVCRSNDQFGRLCSLQATAPQGGLSYIALAGTKRGEGAIITRARRCAADVRTLFDYGDGAQRWALVQTNHDHWLVDPVPAADGGFGADRAGPAMGRMGLARPGLMMPSAPGASGDLRCVTVTHIDVLMSLRVSGRIS